MKLFKIKFLSILIAASLIMPTTILGSEVAGGAPGETAMAALDGAAKFDALLDITQAPHHPARPSVDTTAAILIEANSGAILYANDANSAYFPASITKVMTALLVLEKAKLDDVVTFSYRATHDLEVGSSGIARTDGEQLSVRDCLYALLVASANEVAGALAEQVAGSMEGFADMMNEKAIKLGCTGTHFANPSGLNNEQHYTTAHDMALIMRAAIQNETFVEIASTSSYVIPATNKHSESLTIFSKNKVLFGNERYKYAVCGKTGYTSLAGNTLVTYASNDGLDLICVILHAPSDAARVTTTKKLFDFGFDNYKSYNIGEYGEIASSLGSKGSDSNYFSSNMLSLSIDKKSAVVLPKGIDYSDLDVETIWNKSVSTDGAIGRLVYTYENQIVGMAGIFVDTSSSDELSFLKENTSKDDIFEEEDSSKTRSLRTLLLIAVITIFVIVVVGIIVMRYINGSPRRRKKRAKVGRELRKKLR